MYDGEKKECNLPLVERIEKKIWTKSIENENRNKPI